MAGDWIKMRTWLAKDPKVIGIADFLATHRPFMDWLSDPARKTCHSSAYEHVTRHVTICVTVTGLLQVWGVTREDGERDGDDLVVHVSSPEVFDEIAGFPGLGEALELVGWAVYDEEHHRTIFPKFFQRNASTDDLKRQKDAERQRKRRQKLADESRDSHADESRDSHAKITHREEKRREEIISSFTYPFLMSVGSIPEELQGKDFARAWDRWVAHRAEIKKALKKTMVESQLRMLAQKGRAAAIAMIEHTIAMGWQGLREPDGKESGGIGKSHNQRVLESVLADMEGDDGE